MVGARTAAMGFNRIVDRHIDARNPRTATRELPTGQVGLTAAVALTIASIGLFVAAAAWLGPLCLVLSPVALALVLGYSYTKRFTWLCHLFLGVAIAAGPGGAWIAVTGDISAPPLWLMAAVATWIGGFDILYSLADRDFDRREGLFSIPARFGIRGALAISIGLHVITVVALFALARSAQLGPIYLLGAAIITGLLIWEHAILRPTDLSRLNKAFFDLEWLRLAGLPGRHHHRRLAVRLTPSPVPADPVAPAAGQGLRANAVQTRDVRSFRSPRPVCGERVRVRGLRLT